MFFISLTRKIEISKFEIIMTNKRLYQVLFVRKKQHAENRVFKKKRVLAQNIKIMKNNNWEGIE